MVTYILQSDQPETRETVLKYADDRVRGKGNKNTITYRRSVMEEYSRAEHPSAGCPASGSALPHKHREQNVLHHGGRGQSPHELFILSGGEAAACLATRDREGEEKERKERDREV